MRRLAVVVAFGWVALWGQAEILFKGFTTRDGVPIFSLYSVEERTSKWVSIGQNFSGFRVVSFNTTAETLTIESADARKELHLQRGIPGEQTQQEAAPFVEVRLRLIQITRREGETDATLFERTRDTVLAKLKAGVPFAEVAKQHSTDPRATKGGDWGWQKPSDFNPQILNAISHLKSGEMSPPILRREGCFVLLVEDRR